MSLEVSTRLYAVARKVQPGESRLGDAVKLFDLVRAKVETLMEKSKRKAVTGFESQSK